MRGRVAHEAEVARAADDAAAEVVLPDTVGDHTCGERVVRSRDPAREGHAPSRGAAAGGRRDRRCRRREDRGERGHDAVRGVGLGMGIAAIEDERLGGARTVLGDDERLVDGHPLLLELLERFDPLVVVTHRLGTEHPFPFGADRPRQVACDIASCSGHGREQAALEARTRPAHREALAVVPLEVVETDRPASARQAHGRRLRTPFTVDAVVLEHRAAVDREP